MDFADRLTQAMSRAGVNNRTLADKIGVHEKTVGGWTQGRYRPRDPAVRARLAQILGEDLLSSPPSSPLIQAEGGDFDLSEVPDSILATELARRIAARDTETHDHSNVRPFEVQGYPVRNSRRENPNTPSA